MTLSRAATLFSIAVVLCKLAASQTPEPSCGNTVGASLIQKAKVVGRKVMALEEEDGAAHHTAVSNKSDLCCADFAGWPNVDGGVTCGNCQALVLTAPYGARCDRYCESFGHVCVEAAEEASESCDVMYKSSCSTPIADTSDMLCTCRRPDGHAACSEPVVHEPPVVPEPPAETQCCQPFSVWPDVDGGVTCGGCRALVRTDPYGGRCDKYCASFGHVCVAAAEEKADNCEVSYMARCDEPISGTSDMLCQCHLPAALEICEAPAPPAAKRIEVRGRQVLVDGVPLHLKGVAWNPVAKGRSSVDFRRYVNEDADLMVKAGINAVRTYTYLNDRAVLDALWARGIWVVNSVYNNGAGDPNKVARRVRELKDHPAILMWTIGNEWNYNGLYRKMSSGDSIARIAQVAKVVKANDNSHPVASIYGEVPSQHVIDALSLVDVWGINVYRGIGFDNTFQKFAGRSGKPLFLGEYGADAYNARSNRIDLEAQAAATRKLSEDIVKQSAVHGGVCLGGFVFEFADEWWKDKKGSKSVHNVGGSAPGGGPYPDSTFNEEWWGLVDIDRRPRPAFDAYAQVPLPM